MAAAKKGTIAALIQRLVTKRAEIKAAGAEVTRLKDEEEKIEQEVIDRFDAEGTGTGSSKDTVATVNEDVVPQVADWDKFYEFITENRWFHLLQRRPSTPGCRELFEAGKQIPGVERFTKRKINLRSK